MKTEDILKELKSIKSYALKRSAESHKKTALKGVDAKNPVALNAFNNGHQNGVNLGFSIAYMYAVEALQDLIDEIEAGEGVK